MAERAYPSSETSSLPTPERERLPSAASESVADGNAVFVDAAVGSAIPREAEQRTSGRSIRQHVSVAPAQDVVAGVQYASASKGARRLKLVESNASSIATGGARTGRGADAAERVVPRRKFDALEYLQALSATLRPEQIIEQLAGALMVALRLDGLRWRADESVGFLTKDGDGAEAREVGRQCGHALSYSVTRNGQRVGELTLWRGRRFVNRDESAAEAIVGLTIGPLFNAFEHRRLERLVDLDPLTGLANRRGFARSARAWMADARRQSRPVSLLTVDIDHFKTINDRFGHAYGDRWIVAVADALREMLRDTDPVARFGGEEFVALLPGADLNAAMRCAERVRRAIAELSLPIADDDGADGMGGAGSPASAAGASAGTWSGVRVTATVSIGVAQWQPGLSLDALIDSADQALYAAKRAGRNRVLAASCSG